MPLSPAGKGGRRATQSVMGLNPDTVRKLRHPDKSTVQSNIPHEAGYSLKQLEKPTPAIAAALLTVVVQALPAKAERGLLNSLPEYALQL